jgi:phosphotransacetylase
MVAGTVHTTAAKLSFALQILVLSRGAAVEDIVHTVAIAASQVTQRR